MCAASRDLALRPSERVPETSCRRHDFVEAFYTRATMGEWLMRTFVSIVVRSVSESLSNSLRLFAPATTSTSRRWLQRSAILFAVSSLLFASLATACPFPGGPTPCPSDCASQGGHLHCTAPIIEKENSNQPADGQLFQYGSCHDVAGFCSHRATSCCTSAGSPLAWLGCDSLGECRQSDAPGGLPKLPFGSWGDGLSMSTEEMMIDHTTRYAIGITQCNVNPCLYTTTDTGWGATVQSSNCFDGGPTFKFGILARDHRAISYSGQSRNQAGICQFPFTKDFKQMRIRKVVCPPGFTADSAQTFCYRDNSLQCPITDKPVAVDIGSKRWTMPLSDFPQAFGGFSFFYNSAGLMSTVARGEDVNDYWSWSFGERLEVFQGQATIGRIREADGTIRYYKLDGTELAKRDAVVSTLTRVPTSGTFQYWERRWSNGNSERFDVDGKLTMKRLRDGSSVTLSYTSGNLTQITDQAARGLTIVWTNGRPSQLTLAGQSVATMTYVNGTLTGLQAGAVVQNYAYQAPSNGSPRIPYLLTAVTANGNLLASFQYDGLGRVTRTALKDAPTTETAVRLFAYPTALRTRVTTELGAQINYDFLQVGSARRLSAVSNLCPSCGSSTNQSMVLNTDGLPSTTTDFKGTVTELGYDNEQRVTTRIEARGLDQSPAQLVSNERKTETTWHPGWRVPASVSVFSCSAPLTTSQPCTVASSTRWTLETVTKHAINTRGQIEATCRIDPAIITNPAAFVCSTTPSTQAGLRQTINDFCDTTDADWNSATCPFEGYLKSTNGPRTDVADVTTRTYYSADHPSCASQPATCAYRKGDLRYIDNALGHRSEYVEFDSAGRPLRQKDANGVLTDLAYDVRGRLLSRTVRANSDGSPSANDAITRIEYEAYGEVKRVIQPDNVGLEYCRDQAHRIKAVVQTTFASATRCSNGAPVAGSEAIVYTLDAAGNRTKETTLDITGATRRLMARQFNTLGHLQAIVNAAQANQSNPTIKTSFSYDPNGNLDLTTDTLGALPRVDDNDYDPLNRLIRSIQDKDTTAVPGNVEIGATVEYQYDARDNLRRVLDPKLLPTDYVYDGLDNQTALVSPDTGTTSFTHDKAGNILIKTDNRLVQSIHSYDALNRLTAIVYPSDTTLNKAFYYDVSQADCQPSESFAVGRMARMTDKTGETRFCYDRRGNLTRKVQQNTLFPATQTVQYQYNLADRVVGITYPSGAALTYSRDTQGRINGASVVIDGSTIALVTSVSYRPFGAMSQLSFANGQTLTKTWDQNYWPQAVGGSVLDYGFSVDNRGNITQVASSSEGTQNLAYDRLDRLTQVLNQSSASIEEFTYDKTGNRESHRVGSQPLVDYTYGLNSHRLEEIGDKDGARVYDANGNTISGHLPQREAVYSAENRLSGIASGEESYVITDQWLYNGLGERIQTQVVGSVVFLGISAYVFDPNGRVLSMFQPGATGLPTNMQKTGVPEVFDEVVWFDDQPVARMRKQAIPPPFGSAPELSIEAVHSDHLNTPRALATIQQTGAAPGATTWRWSINQSTAEGSNVFGASRPNEDPDADNGLNRFDLRFAGQLADPSSGLNYNYFRDYEPGTGRYVESDPIGLRGGLSTYGYSRQNPARFGDPLGLFAIDKSCDYCQYDENQYYRIQREAESDCLTVSMSVANWALARCISERCEKSGVIKCDGPGCRPTWAGYHNVSVIAGVVQDNPEIVICIKDRDPTFYDYSGAVAHEFAHSCGWRHGMGGVPRDPGNLGPTR